jgi:hypothetical protein
VEKSGEKKETTRSVIKHALQKEEGSGRAVKQSRKSKPKMKNAYILISHHCHLSAPARPIITVGPASILGAGFCPRVETNRRRDVPFGGLRPISAFLVNSENQFLKRSLRWRMTGKGITDE